VTADRGLAGGYNANVIRTAERAIHEQQAQGRGYSLILLGKKSVNYFRYKHYEVDAAYTGFSEQPTYENAREVAGEVMRRFEEGLIDQVELFYTQFLSVGTQRVVSRRIIPMDATAITEAAVTGAGDEDGTSAGYEFEPDPDSILEQLIPRYVEGRLFGALLEAAASEQAARQRAMKSATDNANELIKVLERIANRARQEAITTEIMEVVGGAEGLSSAKHRVEQ
jgi:F-type H+-transporting ATPase subunit gamma